MGNLDKRDTILETYNLPKLNWEESEKLYRQITTEIEAVIKKPSANKSWTRWRHRQILLNIQRTNTYPSQTVPKKFKRREGLQVLYMRSALS